MSRSLQTLPGEPIIVETLHADYSMAELAAGAPESQKLMDAQPAPVFWIVDMRAAPASFVAPFLAMISRLAATAPRHPNLRQIIYVTGSMSIPDGGGSILLCGSLEDALHYARTRPY